MSIKGVSPSLLTATVKNDTSAHFTKSMAAGYQSEGQQAVEFGCWARDHGATPPGVPAVPGHRGSVGYGAHCTLPPSASTMGYGLKSALKAAKVDFEK